MSLSDAKGLHVVAQTPFDDTGAVDFDSIDSLADFYIKHGSEGFLVLGVSGEAAKLTADETVQVARRFIARAQGKTVIVGVSDPNLYRVAELTAQVMDAGASGVMVAPRGNLRTPDDLHNYFGTLFQKIGPVPVVLQDFPFATGIWMPTPTLLQLVADHAQIQLIKEEDKPSVDKITQLRASKGRRVAILTGNNGVYLPEELGRGADGPMSGFSHPEVLSGVYRLYSAGKIAEAHDLFDTYLPLLNYENQSQWGVAVRKEILRRRGAIRCAAMRPLGHRLSKETLQDIDFLLSRLHAVLATRS